MKTTSTIINNKKLQRQEIIAQYDKTMAEIEKRHEERAANYYNCIDDYSFGSSYHASADSSRINQARMLRDYSLEMLENGYCTIESECSILLDNNGNVCAEGTFYGKFGACFRLFNGGFISVPKKMETIKSKGYTMYMRRKVYKAYFTGKFSQKGNPIFDKITIVNETLTESIESYQTDFIDWLYNQQINKVA